MGSLVWDASLVDVCVFVLVSTSFFLRLTHAAQRRMANVIIELRTSTC